MKRITLISALIMLLFFQVAFGTTYYVATDGLISNDGSINSPWPIAYGISRLTSSDDLEIRGGSYNGNIDDQLQYSGVAGNLISIKNYNNEIVVLNGYLRIEDENYFVVDGIDVVSTQHGIIIDNCENIKILNCDIHSNSHGIWVSESNVMQIDKNIVHDTYGTADGILIQNSDNVELTRNIVYNCYNGVRFYQEYKPQSWDIRNAHVVNNTIYNNSINGISFNYEYTQGNMQYDLDIVVMNNISVDNGYYQLYIDKQFFNNLILDYNDWVMDPSGYEFEVIRSTIFTFLADVWQWYPNLENNSISVDPMFLDENNNDFHLDGNIYNQPISPCINSGSSQASSYVSVDLASGWFGTPDMGALEYRPIYLGLKVYLEALYDPSLGQMRPYANIPLTSPYAEDPIDVSVIPNNVVDWVLVELRKTYNGAPVVVESAFLYANGTIGDVDGTVGKVDFDMPIDESVFNYYIVIEHRKHLPAITYSAQNMYLGNVEIFDFTICNSGYHSSCYPIEVASSKWGMRNNPSTRRRDLVLQNITESSNKVYEATNSITAGPNYVIPNGRSVSFTAGNIITLRPTFNADYGSSFIAKINSSFRGDYNPPLSKSSPPSVSDRPEQFEEEYGSSDEIGFKNEFDSQKNVAVEMPTELKLYPNSPNPFNPSTNIKYALPSETDVSLKIYNIYGQLVKTLVNEHESAGYNSVTWDATNSYGNVVPSGIYFCVLQTATGFKKVNRMVLLK